MMAMATEPPRYYRFAEFLLDAREHTLTRNGRPEYLTPKTFETLLVLLRNAGQVLSKDDLIARIWEGGVVTDNALTRCIKEVRSALGDDASAPRFIETVPRLGYRFVAAVEAPASPPLAETGGTLVERPVVRTRLPWNSPGVMVGGLLAALALAAAILYPRATPPAPPNSVVVLPFANLGADPDTGHFADGVTEEVLNALAGVGELRVVARTSAFSFKGRDLDVREIAEALGVRHVVEGSVRRSGDRLRVTAQLIEADTGFHQWSQTYEGRVDDVFAFQENIAEGVADALGRTLGQTGLGRKVGAIGQTAHIETYDTYLLARQIWRQRQPEPIRRSIELLEEVVAAEPDFAAGWSALASACLTLAAYAAESGDAWQCSAEAAQRALALDVEQAEAHSVLATHALVQRDWVTAAKRHRRAVELAPNNSTVRLWYSELLMRLGHVAAAVEQSGIAVQLDPMYSPALGNAGHQLAVAGRLDAAAERFRRAWDLGLEAMFVWVGNFYVAVMLERYDEAGRWLDRRPTAHGVEADRALLAARRQPTVANRAALVAATLAGLDQGLELRVAAMYLAVGGATDAAFERLQRAAASDWVATESLWHPWTRPLREDQRFDALARALGMFEYWQIYGPPDACVLDSGRLQCRR
jgi:TolB-like protein/DNA-binding winged helix-turn-helix (wHTH) protein/Tfp pilus assembly protein PilF